jgi:hypothetical protein
MSENNKILQIVLSLLFIGMILPIGISIFYTNQLENEPYAEYFDGGVYEIHTEFGMPMYGEFNITMDGSTTPQSNDSVPIYQSFIIGNICNNTITNTTYNYHFGSYDLHNITLCQNYTFPYHDTFEFNISVVFDGDTEVNFNLTGIFIWIHWNESLDNLNPLYIVIPLVAVVALGISFLYGRKNEDG